MLLFDSVSSVSTVIEIGTSCSRSSVRRAVTMISLPHRSILNRCVRACGALAVPAPQAECRLPSYIGGRGNGKTGFPVSCESHRSQPMETAKSRRPGLVLRSSMSNGAWHGTTA
jgi:hypothetical protein